jgi:hypothetical protein
MPTQLDNTWLPGYEKALDTNLLGGLEGTTQVSKEVLRILKSLEWRKYRGLQTIPMIKLLMDNHSKISSDDLLWYISGTTTPEDMKLLADTIIRHTNIVIPRILSWKIQSAITNLIW